MHESGELTLAGDTSEGMPSFSAHERGPGLQRGDRLGRYTVLELLGHGGMGLVYTAYDPQLDRRVAVKVLRARGTRGATERARQRLLREAQAMAKLSHPNVVAVHDVGTFADEVFLAMEFVDGSSLERWLKEAPRGWREVLGVFVDAGRGLAAAHAVGLVHRDFKPANVLLDRAGRARVTDFGLAQIGEPSSFGSSELSAEITGPSLLLTEGDALVGTPAYMAPEQHARTGVDARTDQFGFCVALYEALYGCHPFGGETLVEMASAVSRGKLREPPGDSEVPAYVRRAVMRGLARDPEARWPDMNSLLVALLDDPARRHRRWLGAAAVVAGIAGVVALTTRPRAAAPEPPPPCEGAGGDVDEVWSPARRDAIASAFAATGEPHAATVWARSAEVLDGYAVRWRGSARDACEATRVRGEQSDSLFDLRRACLDRRLHELDVRLRLLEGVDAKMVDHGFDVATSLTPIDVCEDARRLTELVPLPEDPRQAEQVSALQKQLEILDASRLAGRSASLTGNVQEALARAIELGHAPTRSEARRLAYLVQEDLGHWSEAESLLYATLEDAAEARDDELTAYLWCQLPYLVGYLQTRFTDVELLLPGARAALARAGRPSKLVGNCEYSVGSMRLRQGDRKAARTHYMEALARFNEGDGIAAGQAPVLNNLGVLDMLDGDYEASRAWFMRAYEAREGLRRPDSHEVVDHHQNLANLALAQGDFRECVEQIDRALEVIRSNRSTGGPQELLARLVRAQALSALYRFDEARADVDRAMLLSAQLHGPDHAKGFGYAAWLALARLEREVGNLDAARTAIARAIELSRKVLGEDNYELASLLAEHGIIELRAGNLDLAAERLDEALRRSEAGYGAEHPQTAAFLRWRGSLDLRRGNVAKARERLERAVEILDRRHGDVQELARGRFDLARALPEADRARARRLAEQARERLVADEAKDEVGAIDAWLGEHPL